MRVANALAAPMALLLAMAAPARGAGFQIKVTGPQVRAGEPELAVNPRNADNIVFFAMTATRPFVRLGKGTWWKQKGFLDCQISVSFDRGRTWRARGNPFMTGRQTLCADPMVAFAPDGTVYAAADGMSVDPTNPKHWLLGEVEVSRSLDGGRSWTSPIISGTPYDRPYLVVDGSDGTVYLSSSCADPIASYCEAHVRFVLESRDRGLTWSRPMRIDTPRYPSRRGGFISAAGGWLAVAYVSPAGRGCPCLVFGRTRDAGASWMHARVPTSQPIRLFAQVAADPARRDAYAVVAQSGDRLTYLVYVTRDGGRTWHGPARIENAPRKVGFKSWLAFSPEGVLGFLWRADDAPPAEVPLPLPEVQPKRTFPYALWGTISRDGGASFSPPLQLSDGPSPAPKLGELGPPDDESFVAVGRRDMHYGWGDWREGDLAAWYGRMPLARFARPRR
jgi:BNR repeat-like domain